MIRCVRIWTNNAGSSSFEEGELTLPKGKTGDLIGNVFPASSVSFRETQVGNDLACHDAPTPQFVLTLTGTLEFETREGHRFMIRPGDVLLAEDTTGSGHRWRLLGDEPWRRAYVILPSNIESGFAKSS